MKSARGSGAGHHQIRIIGGVHRGRRLSFPEIPGLRPTGDRIRETLFNWLRQQIPGARCLDLFAGSGALGLEAASRGAQQVVLVEEAVPAVRRLRQNVDLLALPNVDVVCADARQWLRGPIAPFDVVFLDPPFNADLLPEICRMLDVARAVKAGGKVYLEADRRRGLPPLPPHWTLLRNKQAGDVVYGLAQVNE